MPDNVGYTPGSGATIAADEIGTALYQRMKLIYGDDGVNAGDVSASNPLPVYDATSDFQNDRMIALLRFVAAAYDGSLNRQRGTVVVESGTVTASVSNATIGSGTITTLQNLGSYPADFLNVAAARAAWADTMRARIT